MSILFPSNTTETLAMVGAIKRGEVIQFIDLKHDSGQSAKFNPIQSSLHDLDAAISFLDAAAGGSTEPAVLNQAKEVLGGLVSGGGEVTMLKVVEAFETVPELDSFAVILRKTVLPGPFGQYFAD